MTGKPFLDNAGLAWLYCDQCRESYLADSEHACPRLTLAQGFALALTLGALGWVLIGAGFWTLGWLPSVPW